MAGKRGTREAPPALKHGLASRWSAEALEEEVEALAPLLVGASPRLESIMAAARRAAEAILQLRLVRNLKLHVLRLAQPSHQAPEKLFPAIAHILPGEAYRLFEAEMRERLEMMKAFEGKKTPTYRSVGTAANALLDHLDAERALLARLDDYERKALSKRTKALRELDYERVEAERQAASSAPGQASRAR